MGHDYSKDIDHLRDENARKDRAYQEDVSRRETERARNEREAREALQEQQERMVRLQQQDAERLLNAMKEKDREIEQQRQEREQALLKEREISLNAIERTKNQLEDANNQMSNAHKQHQVDLLKQTEEFQKKLEEKNKEQALLHEEMMEWKKKNEEDMFRRLHDQWSEFQTTLDANRKIVESKDTELKNTMTKVLETQTEGMKNVEEARKILSEKHKVELEKMDKKIDDKAKEVIEANEKIFITQKEGAEKVEQIIKEKEAEKEKAIEKADEKSKAQLSKIEGLHKMQLEGEREHAKQLLQMSEKSREDNREFLKVIMAKEQLITNQHEKMLESQIKAHEKIQEIQQERIKEIKMISAQDRLTHMLMLASVLNKSDNPAMNQLLDLVSHSLQNNLNMPIEYKNNKSEEGLNTIKTTTDASAAHVNLPPGKKSDDENSFTSEADTTQPDGVDLTSSNLEIIFNIWEKKLNDCRMKSLDKIVLTKLKINEKVMDIIDEANKFHAAMNQNLISSWEANCKSFSIRGNHHIEIELLKLVNDISYLIETHGEMCKRMLDDFLKKWGDEVKTKFSNEFDGCHDRLKLVYESAKLTKDVQLMRSRGLQICEPFMDGIKQNLPCEDTVSLSLEVDVQPAIQKYLEYLKSINKEFKIKMSNLINDILIKDNGNNFKEAEQKFMEMKADHMKSVEVELNSSLATLPALLQCVTRKCSMS